MSGKKYFTLSFDDGAEHDKKLIATMKQYGLKGTFNLCSGRIGTKPKISNIQFIPKDEIRQVYEGFEIASHGFEHDNFWIMSSADTERSINTDVLNLTSIAGYPIVGHAYPYGAFTKAAEAALQKNGIQYARCVYGKGSFQFPENPLKYTPTCWFNAKNVLQLIQTFVDAEPTEEDMLFTMWGHSFEMEYGFRKCSEKQLNLIFSKIAGKSDIIYCSNKEAFEHVEK